MNQNSQIKKMELLWKIKVFSKVKYVCAEGGPRLPIAHALRLLSTEEGRFGG